MSGPSLLPEHVELCRFWIEFVLPPYDKPDGIVVDGAPGLHRALESGVGVTAHDLADALDVVAVFLIEWNVIASPSELPPVSRVERDIDVSTLDLFRVGNPVWRGIWFPPHNLEGPIRLGPPRF